MFSWDSYKYGTSDSNFTKYNSTDGKTQLDNDDDDVYLATNGVQRMPTQAELQELYEETNNRFITLPNGVKGMVFENKSDPTKAIFIPLTGFCSIDSLINDDTEAYLWSSTRYADASFAYRLYFDSSKISIYQRARMQGLSVRGVSNPND